MAVTQAFAQLLNTRLKEDTSSLNNQHYIGFELDDYQGLNSSQNQD